MSGVGAASCRCDRKQEFQDFSERPSLTFDDLGRCGRQALLVEGRLRSTSPSLIQDHSGNNAPMASAASRCMLGMQWEYVSRVIATVEWPRRSLMIFGCTCALSARVACVCRRS